MPTLEININWSVFEQSERDMLEKAIEMGHHEQLAAILNDVTPEKAEEIAKIQRQFRPKEFVFESQAQKEFEMWLSKNSNELTPEIEAEWQAKIEAERAEKLKAMGGNIVDASVALADDGKSIAATFSNDLHAVKGLGAASVKRLNDAGVFSVEELRKLSQTERSKILGPLVSGKLKDLT